MIDTQVIDNDVVKQLRGAGNELRKAGRRVWLAGLGAVGTVGETGWQLASDLIERGRELEKRERPSLERRFRTGRERLQSLGRENADRVRGFGREMEERIETQVAEGMRRFGVPSRDDIHELSERIEELSRKVEALAARR